MRSLCVVLAGILALPSIPAAFAQEPAHALNLVIVEGDGAINNLRQRTARAPIVEVQDENHKPVAGAVVLFTLLDHGPGGTFADGSHTLRVVTDSQGRASAHGIHLNGEQGQFQIQVNASYNGLTASTSIAQSTAAAGAGAGSGGAAAGISGKVVAIIVIAAAAVAGGAYLATHTGGGNNNSTTTTGTTITPGTGTVGPPSIIIGRR